MLSLATNVVVKIFSILKRDIIQRTSEVCRHIASVPANITVRRSFLTGVLVLCSCNCGYGTALVLFYTDSWAVLGIDSLIIRFDGQPITTCKMEHVGGVFFAMAKTLSDTDSGGNYDAMKIARESMAAVPRSIAQRYEVFEQALKAKLIPATQRARLLNDPNYRKWISGDYILAAAFVGIEGGKVVAITKRFELKSNGGIGPREEQKIVSGTGLTYFPAAEAMAIDPRLVPVERVGAEVATERIIKAAIAIAPEVVGPPIAIVRLDSKGYKWFGTRPSFCPE
jgi:hypothetical protein